MSPGLYLVLIIVAGLALAWLAGEMIDRKRTSVALMLAWLSLCFLWAFIKYP